MEKTISKKISVNTSVAKPSVKPPPRDKNLGLETAIRFCDIEDSYKTEEGEEAEILVVHDSKCLVSKKKLVRRNFPYTNTFDHEGPAVVSAIRDLNVGVFEHLEITSPMDIYQRIAYIQRIMRGAALKKYKAVLEKCQQL